MAKRGWTRYRRSRAVGLSLLVPVVEVEVRPLLRAASRSDAHAQSGREDRQQRCARAPRARARASARPTRVITTPAVPSASLLRPLRQHRGQARQAVPAEIRERERLSSVGEHVRQRAADHEQSSRPVASTWASALVCPDGPAGRGHEPRIETRQHLTDSAGGLMTAHRLAPAAIRSRSAFQRGIPVRTQAMPARRPPARRDAR